MKMLLLKYFFSCTVIVASVYGQSPVVQTRNGAVQGLQGSTVETGDIYYSFRGIPYAEPPVGQRRFEPPVAKSNWQGVLDATKDGASCIQGAGATLIGAEDCLFVNVYTPTLPSATCEPLPVLLWVYGGGFEGGESKYENHGPDHIIRRGIVVVTFNYRLGLLGFLSTGDSVAPGNNGLKDQLLALQWVRDNVRSFCGNPNEVTLAGQSAGSASVAYHIQAPKSQGLFHRAILSSGTSLDLWAYSRRVPQTINLVAQDLGIDTSSSRAIVDGLKALEVVDLQTRASATISAQFTANNPREGLVLGPVSEYEHPGAFFTGRSHQLLESGQFNKVPILIGYNSLEGTYDIEAIFRLFLVSFDLNPERLVPIDMNVATSRAVAAGREIKSHYFGWIPISLSNMELLKYLSHDQFVRGIREFARLVHKHAPVYLYKFSYEGGLWGIYNRTRPGTTHSEELGYYWVSPHQPSSDHDLVVRERMITLITNFVKHSNPTPTLNRVLQDTIWDIIGTELRYLDIGRDLVLSQHPDQNDMQFWDNFEAKYGVRPYATY